MKPDTQALLDGAASEHGIPDVDAWIDSAVAAIQQQERELEMLTEALRIANFSADTVSIERRRERAERAEMVNASQLRRVMMRWHRQALLLGFDGVQDLIAKEQKLEARVAGDDPVRALIAKHAGLLADGPYAHYCYFELAYTRHTGWMAWICSNQREEDPDRKVLAKGQGWTPDEACRAALADLTPNV
jgi:hypothetical protein